jgi:histone H1/5
MQTKGKKTYLEIIIEAVKSLNECNGSSRQAIVKYITSNYDIDPKNIARVRTAISKAIEDGSLKFGKCKFVRNKFKNITKI